MRFFASFRMTQMKRHEDVFRVLTRPLVYIGLSYHRLTTIASFHNNLLTIHDIDTLLGVCHAATAEVVDEL